MIILRFNRCECGRFTKPVVVQLGVTIFSMPLCDRCKKREALADKRRAVLQANLRKAYGE